MPGSTPGQSASCRISKAGRDGDSETWVAHSGGEWTEEHIDDAPEEIKSLLIEEFWNAVGRVSAEPIHAAVHRWRFAIPQQPLATNCLFDDEFMIAACGDWCGGPRVEGAFLSGMAIAGRVLGRINSIPVPALQKGQ